MIDPTDPDQIVGGTEVHINPDTITEIAEGDVSCLQAETVNVDD